MVKLTESFIKKKSLQKQLQKSMTKEVDKDHIKKLTHLFMDEQYIDEIEDLSHCRNLKVIYLQKNEITKIENLDFAVKLTHLYLQHNRITKIENLECLVNIQKLYLGHNSISVIEGLENLFNLTELHVEKQKLDLGERLCFEPRTTNTLSIGLRYLNVSENKLTSLSDINHFEKLTTLEAKDNLINDIEDLTDTICSLPQLKHLYLQGNPATKPYRYRENLIANSYSLTTLDDKKVTEYSKVFLKRFKEEMLHQSQRKCEIRLSDDITNSLNLPPAFKRSVSRAMLQKINPKFSFPGISMTVDHQPQIFPPWKSTPSVKALKDNHIVPRQLWKSKINKQTIERKDLSKPPVIFL